jgi:hypothetical protein
MWLATKHGFFSFSNLADGDIAIRSRVRGDLQNIQELFHSLEIHCIAGNGEYGWETILGAEQTSALLALILQTNTDGDNLAQAVHSIPGQANKGSAYQHLDAELLKLQLDDLGDRLIPGRTERGRLENDIRENIRRIAKQSCLVGVDEEGWDVTRISWTGEEWEGFRPIPGYCYVEAFEHSNPPHDFIYLVGVRTGEPEFAASYEGDMDTFELTVTRLEAGSLDLPESVLRS